MRRNIQQLWFILLSVCLMIFFIQCTTVSEEQTTTSSQPTMEVQPIKTWKDPRTDMEFVWIPKGCYEMGCGSWTKDCLTNEIPAHEVCIDGFWLSKYEVTQGQWKQLMRSNNSRFNLGDVYPVESVSWQEAQKYIDSLNGLHDGRYQFRLPTEAEWEYAARSGGQPEMFAGGNNVKSVAWFRANSRDNTHPVGKKAPNGLGLFDMSGNVWEWCQDLYSPEAYRRHTKNNPAILDNASDNRVARGGGYNGFSRLVRCAQRIEFEPGLRDRNIGFRIAMNDK